MRETVQKAFMLLFLLAAAVAMLAQLWLFANTPPAPSAPATPAFQLHVHADDKRGVVCYSDKLVLADSRLLSCVRVVDECAP